jgi:hypothetical protein
MLNSFSQQFVQGTDFNSQFKNVKSGEFSGILSGVIFIKTTTDILAFDFQSTAGSLTCEPDTNEMYDVSYKIYRGKTTSGKTQILYSTYASSNFFSISLKSGVYSIGSHDGASDMVVNGIQYKYFQENNIEYLSLIITKDLTLSNFWWLRNNGTSVSEANKNAKEITLLSNSTLIFTLKK